MEFHTSADVSYTMQILTMVAFIFVIYAYLPIIQYRAQLAKLPVFGGSSTGERQRLEYLASAKKLYMEGYGKFRESVYRITAESGEDHVVVPLALLPELRKLPDDVLSFPKAVEKIMEVRYTKMLIDLPLIVHTVKSDLTPALVRLNSTICEEVDTAIREYMPICEDWTNVCINKKLVDIITRVSGRIFVGPDLCRNPEYLEAASTYAVDIVLGLNAVKRMRPCLRPFLASYLPAIRQIREREKRATEYLRPIVQERMEAKKNNGTGQGPDDMLQWMIDRSGDTKTVAELAQLQLGLAFAAIHTTTQTVTNILYTLAVTSEYVVPLREEISQAMANNGGIITFQALQKMGKLDSYMKEVQRVYPQGVTSFNRRVLKGITLSNGQYIPPGVTIEVPSQAIHADSTYYPNGDTFDGFRHYKLRSGGTLSDHARNQFVTTNELNLAFGYGKHACPGRFFAANEIKMILARVILGYDIRMPEEEGTERYVQVDIGRQSSPPQDKMLMFKKVEI